MIKKYLKLNDGNKIPTLGLGTWKSESDKVGEAVRFAILDAGYNHIDCAAIYNNEKEIGEVFKDIFEKNLKREKVFITSKLWNTEHHPKRVEKACKQTLSDLKLDYLDLYLMHWGVAFKKQANIVSRVPQTLEPISIQQTWQAMEGLVKKGLVKSIGVSNFTTIMIIDLLTYAKIKPVVNQIELHPYLSQQELIDFCKKQGIIPTAYSPLGRPGYKDVLGPKLIDEPIIKKLAKKYQKSPAQILLNWAILRETVVIPKSTTFERILENINIFDFELTAKEQNQINALNKNYRIVNPGEWWEIPYFF